MNAIPFIGNDKEMKRLVRLLDMTASDFDGEALVAAKKARGILERYQLTYDRLFEELSRSGHPGHARQLQHLQRIIVEQRREIAALKRQASTPVVEGDGRSYGGDLSNLKKFLEDNVPLRAHEKKLLESIPTTVEPKTKSAYLLLICAKRHGVTVDGQFLN